MGRIVATEYVSLDGLVQAPGGFEDFKHAGWLFEFDQTLNSEALLMGRLTYEIYAELLSTMNGA
jgi:dihydrofolate reductase